MYQVRTRLIKFPLHSLSLSFSLCFGENLPIGFMEGSCFFFYSGFALCIFSEVWSVLQCEELCASAKNRPRRGRGKDIRYIVGHREQSNQ